MQTKLFLSIQSLSRNVSYYKSRFEHHYYTLFNVYDSNTTTKVNHAFTILVCFLLGGLQQSILEIWKPMYQWSMIEFGAIGYFTLNMGYWFGKNLFIYFQKISKKQYKSKLSPVILSAVKPRKGDSYLNPINIDDADEDVAEALLMLSKND